jgi:hypothetical protein
VALAAVIVLAGVGLLYFGITTLTKQLAAPTEQVEAFALTADQTRAALDGGMPALPELMSLYWEEEHQQLLDAGLNVFVSTRQSLDTPDPTAGGQEYLKVPTGVTEEQVQGFYQGSYNAYTVDELVGNFNGAWLMDDAVGDMGRYIRIKYANFNATSIGDEIMHLAQLQGFSSGNSRTLYQGPDDHDNTVMIGTTTLEGEIPGTSILEGTTTLYWRIAACPFGEIYYTGNMPSSAVYVSCVVATYDFYTGSDNTIDRYLAQNAAM